LTDPDAALPRAQVVFPEIVQVHFDGACDPPKGGGIATYGFLVEGEALEYEEYGLAVPPWSLRATNNVAEYVAAVRALEWLRGQGYRGQVLLLGDSQLVIRQMEGEYEVRAEHLKPYHDHLHELSRQFQEVRYVWVPREQNTRADMLSKIALEEARSSAGRFRPGEPLEEESRKVSSPRKDSHSAGPRST
jgi:ribonuclease HI